MKIVIVGAGPGGYNCATRCGQLGLKVALIEKRDKLGGTCLNVGCIPSKALLHASELYETAGKDFAALGIEVTGLKLNLDNMLKQKADAVTGLTNGVAFIMKKNKVTVYNGAGRIDGPGRVVVTGEKGETVLEAKNIVIATGSEPTPLPGVEIDEERFDARHAARVGAALAAHLDYQRERVSAAGTAIILLYFLNFAGLGLILGANRRALAARPP
mgnify:CR=1 FL=1